MNARKVSLTVNAICNANVSAICINARAIFICVWNVAMISHFYCFRFHWKCNMLLIVGIIIKCFRPALIWHTDYIRIYMAGLCISNVTGWWWQLNVNSKRFEHAQWCIEWVQGDRVSKRMLVHNNFIFRPPFYESKQFYGRNNL